MILQGAWCTDALPRAAPLTSRWLRRVNVRGRACLRHGCGQRTPPRAQGMAAGQPSRTGGRRDALESLGDFRPELAVAAPDV
jgi:hypothetical protein